MRFLLPALAVALVSALHAQTYGGGQTNAGLTSPTISNLTLSASSSSIVAQWVSSSQADTHLACGTASGAYSNVAADDGVQQGTLRHIAIVAGLNAGTTYFCQATSGNSAGATSATATVATLTPSPSAAITGVSYGAVSAYSSTFAGRAAVGDTFYNAVAADGRSYLTTDDTSGWYGGGYQTWNSNTQLVVLDGAWPAPGHTVNGLTGYGQSGSCVPPDNISFKDSGLFALDGKLFMLTGRQLNANCSSYVPGSAFKQAHGEMMWSPDYGQTWNTYQKSTTLDLNGLPTTTGMFPTVPSTWATAAFVMYGADDGTLGYLNPVNRHDNGDAYVYLVANEGYWNNGSNYYLARVARAKLTPPASL